MKSPRVSWSTIAALLLAACGPVATAEGPDDFFETKIRPVLVETCLRCHGDAKTSGGLRLDSREALLAGGDSGPAIEPGNPDESLLVRAIRRQDDVSAMPPGKGSDLRPDQVADFVAWVESGAAWPETTAKFEAAAHWAFEKPRRPAPPSVHDKTWPRSSIDAFLLARLEAEGRRPAPPADRAVLIRRAAFDLTGLPPKAEEVEAFERDSSPSAFEKVVDRLLASPAYGERWGRHWLDVVRYADTAGETADFPVPLAWRYRNYVIDAFNADKPYDEFLREQIAGDVLADQGPPERHAERVTATGYLAISRRFGFDSENYHHLTIQDTIDTLGQSVLGLSLGCARCHDHKFDPVTLRDYYGLYGIFDSTRYAFPGSEQKQKVRAMLPLLPRDEAQRSWVEYRKKVATLSIQAAGEKASPPATVLRSLYDIDGDFELQAAAAGGSNGVLVPPWLYEGRVDLTAEAQSPFRNLFPPGKVGVSVPAGDGAYRVRQAVHARRPDDDTPFHVSLDFRVPATKADDRGRHAFVLAFAGGLPAAEVLFSSESLSLRSGSVMEDVGRLKANEWHALRLALDPRAGTLTLKVETRGPEAEVAERTFPLARAFRLESVEFRSVDPPGLIRPALEFDNLGIQDAPPGETPGPADRPDADALRERLAAIAGIDGDLELQTEDSPPSAPWNAGPNSVVKLSGRSQSPFANVYPTGALGFHMPNRAEYDGLGQTLAKPKTDEQGRLFLAFDFRCASIDAGGSGSWRYYIGRGPGNSAAVELFFNGETFFRRSGDATDPVASIRVGEWNHVQLVLDARAKTYTGSIASPSGATEFRGATATGWDGAIDYTFVDSYGHVGGVRPALDLDNFAVRDEAFPALKDGPGGRSPAWDDEARRKEAAELRDRLSQIERDAERRRRELDALIAEGPYPMTYGVVEGTPHDVKIQNRGEPDQPGPQVPRGFVKVLGGSELRPGASGSGRLELAGWLVSDENPLTARVMANRIWQYHFGRGLVATPNDLGVRGLPPTHPELLDWLAVEFRDRGWSIKALHRLIMLSAAYQQSSDPNPDDGATASPDLYASFPRRRMSAEEIRDAILAVSGELDPTPGREHPFPPPSTWGFSQHGPFLAVYDHDKRSVYLMTQRLKRHPFLGLFDGADPNATTASRMITTVPTQALFFLNDPFVHDKSMKWAARLLAERPGPERRIASAWLAAIGRAPTEAEADDAVDFLAAYRDELTALKVDQVELHALAAYLRTILGGNAFLYLD